MLIYITHLNIKKVFIVLICAFVHSTESYNINFINRNHPFLLSTNKIEPIQVHKRIETLDKFQLNKNKNVPKYNQKNTNGDKCNCHEIEKTFDVIVIGGGHSGCEASHISAKSDAKTLLITQKIDTIGEMSCNPSIGGIGKGILVKEIDALGGLMGKVIDKSGIHFKILNVKKGLAVRGHRAQADRDLYNFYMKQYIFSTKKLIVLENIVQSLLIENACNMKETGQKIYGVKTQCGCEFYAFSVILTTGTFLGGICHIGKKQFYGGRLTRLKNEVSQNQQGRFSDAWMELTEHNEEEKDSVEKLKKLKKQEIVDAICNNNLEMSTNDIAKQLIENDFEIKRMKTGTPPRLDIKSINFSILEKEETEKKNPFFFSFLNSNKENENNTLACYKTYTNENTHKLVLQHIDELPDFDSHDKLGNGPRYCPSIAKKVTKFSQKKKHIVWLEPEGFNSNLIYPNGLSSAFPLYVQKKIINSIKGLEEAKILFPAYDVEYFFVNPTCLDYTLETKQVKGLFLAGQICGTTGYEEAACQGIVAGINAAIYAKKHGNGKKENQNIIHDETIEEERFFLKRTNSYIGVLIHDLINKGVSEPYRIFTSRAEYRLFLRPDNADIRLTPKAHTLGIVSKERMENLRQKYSTVNKLIFVFKQIGLKAESESESEPEMKKIELNKNNTNRNDIDGLTNEKAYSNLENDFQLYFISEKDKNKNISLYNILKSGKEYPIHILLKKLKDLQKQKQFSNLLSTDCYENNLQFYFKKNQQDLNLTFFKSELFLLQLANLETACAEVKYSSYLKKQIIEINKIKKNFNLVIPRDTIYDRAKFPYLSNEEIEKLNKFKPKNLKEANRIEGVTVSAIYYLYHYIKNKKREKEQMQ